MSEVQPQSAEQHFVPEVVVQQIIGEYQKDLLFRVEQVAKTLHESQTVDDMLGVINKIGDEIREPRSKSFVYYTDSKVPKAAREK